MRIQKTPDFSAHLEFLVATIHSWLYEWARKWPCEEVWKVRKRVLESGLIRGTS
jgi:hypothetical protein